MERGRDTLYFDYRSRGSAGEHDEARPRMASDLLQSIPASAPAADWHLPATTLLVVCAAGSGRRMP
jgi:hypothetical protein